MITSTRNALLLSALAAVCLGAAPATAEPATLDAYARQAQAEDPSFGGFSAQRGETLFRARFASGKAETPACVTCHGDDPRMAGRTRAGKAIEPMALSVSPNRYGDIAKTEKWFRRNCDSVLGRACTAREKGDFIAFMTTQ